MTDSITRAQGGQIDLTQVPAADPGSCCAPAETAGERKVKQKNLRVYDPPMCCSTGVCGPNVDPALVRFAADLKWLEGQGVSVDRYNLAQQPMAFAENEVVRARITDDGEKALPLVLVDGKVVASGAYPSREELRAALDMKGAMPLVTPEVAELVAIGAAIAANCETCLRVHVRAATELGVTLEDIARAVETAAKVKEFPHRNILKLAALLTQPQAGQAKASH